MIREGQTTDGCFLGQPEMKLGCGKFFCFILIEAKALGLSMLGFGKIEVSRVRGKKTRTSTWKVHREFVQHLQRGETSQHKARQNDVLFVCEEACSN